MLNPFPDSGEIRFFKVRDAGRVVNAVVAFVRRNFRELIVSFFALVGPFALITGIGTALYFQKFGAVFSDPDLLASGDPEAVFGDMFGPAYFVTILGSLLAFAIAQATVAAYVRLYREGEAGNITVGMVWEDARGLILPVIGMSLLIGAVGTLSAVVAIIPCLGILAVLGFWAWATPYVHVMFASRMTETDSIGEAFGRAKLLVKGSWASAFGAIALTWLLSYAVIMLLSLPLYIVMMVVGINSVAASGDPGAMFSWMGPLMAPFQILGMAAYILPALAAFFVHGRLAQEVDGSGLDDELDLFEEGVDTSRTATWDSQTRPSADAPPASDEDDPFDDGDDTPDHGDSGAPSGFRGGGFGS